MFTWKGDQAGAQTADILITLKKRPFAHQLLEERLSRQAGGQQGEKRLGGCIVGVFLSDKRRGWIGKQVFIEKTEVWYLAVCPISLCMVYGIGRVCLQIRLICMKRTTELAHMKRIYDITDQGRKPAFVQTGAYNLMYFCQFG